MVYLAIAWQQAGGLIALAALIALFLAARGVVLAARHIIRRLKRHGDQTKTPTKKGQS